MSASRHICGGDKGYLAAFARGIEAAKRPENTNEAECWDAFKASFAPADWPDVRLPFFRELGAYFFLPDGTRRGVTTRVARVEEKALSAKPAPRTETAAVSVAPRPSLKERAECTISARPAETAWHGSDEYRFVVAADHLLVHGEHFVAYDNGSKILDVSCSQQRDYVLACERHGVSPRVGTPENFRDHKERISREYEKNESLYVYSRRLERDVLATSDEGRAIIAERTM